jgi:hypothetical protein
MHIRIICILNAYSHCVHYICQKRPTKETYICQKRPTKETCVHSAFALCAFWHTCCGQGMIMSHRYMSKETCICQKRPTKETCVHPAFALYAFCHKCCGQYIILSDICHKRPIYVKRDLQQTPVYNLHLHYMHFVINAAVNIHDHVTQIYVKRHSHMSKDTYKRVLSSCHTDD